MRDPPGLMHVGALLQWYARTHRPLPWRASRDPYAILVSEVMLQQTQAARVVPYYGRFMERFPDPATLAAAPVADVLACWSGLGYNRRALALRAAAADVAARGWPPDAAGLRRLGGVGPYTAAAVAAFAFGEQVAAVDTNVRRVLERHDGIPRTPAALARRASELLPEGRAAQFNQAMMELGATVCLPRRPNCGACPIRRTCAGQRRPAPPAPPRRRRAGGTPRFEDTDRWLRGRVVAAALAGDPPPEADAARLARVVDALVRDGLVVRDLAGRVHAP